MQFKDLTTFKIGGPIKHFFEVRSDEEIVRAGKFAKENRLKIFILGGGSDILVSDKGFDGVVIKYIGNSVRRIGDMVTAQAGTEWDKLVEYSVKNNLQGIECLSGIPGTVGASPVQNIGAYRQELQDTFVSLTAYDFKEEKFVEFRKENCNFGYRESTFKKKENRQRYLITSVTLKLKPNTPVAKIRTEILKMRAEKLENPQSMPNAGSFFLNPIITQSKFESLKKKYPDISGYPQDGGIKIHAGWLIEKTGWRGKTYQGAAVSGKNALILVNPNGQASSQDVVELSRKIQKSVFDKFKVKLEPEVQFVGFGKKVAILGYGLEGQDAEKYFKSLGDSVTILDRKFDENYLTNLNSFDIIVRSPGVYRYLPEIVKAEKSGVEITSAIKIFFDQCKGKIIGVTGTKGKGTTSTLIYEILKNAGCDVYLAGNIGKPYLELLPKLTKDSFVILELSSFQLIDLTKSPQIAVVLNITLDHLDWHKNKEEYINAKKNIVKYQTINDFAVINSEYAASKSFIELTKGGVVLFNKSKLEDKYKENLLLRGEHNLENIAAAVSVAKILKIKEDIILKTVQSFKGLEHRLELVKEVSGVFFYNDSFATGPQPTIAAIKSFTEPETLILGGSDKGLSYDELGKVIGETKNIKTIILIGQIAGTIKKSIMKFNYQGKILELGKTKMEKIVETAYQNTLKGGVAILSPAAASFDMFANYKDRGNQFKKAVKNLI